MGHFANGKTQKKHKGQAKTQNLIQLPDISPRGISM